MTTHTNSLFRLLLVILTAAFLSWQAAAAPATVPEAMDVIVTRLYAEHDEAFLGALTVDAAQSLITPEERAIFATKHWTFNVDQPAVVSILRDTAQKEVPFWLKDAGFAKTEMVCKNAEKWTYEVWQKKVSAGPVELGINGFDNHRPHYLVAVAAQEPGVAVNITNLQPGQYPVATLKKGAFAYNDWPDLLFTEVPAALEGQALLTSIRGRSRDAHLAGGAFRHTDHPSGEMPDEVLLTWSDDPRTTQTIQWRTSTKVAQGAVRYGERGAKDFSTQEVKPVVLEDRMLANDRFNHRYTATLTGLKPGTAYTYSVGDPAGNHWSEAADFTTAPDKPQPFTFLWTGDAHNRPDWGRLVEHAVSVNPQSAFLNVAGDNVGTGQYRNHWDEYFYELRNVSNRVRIMPVLGNHDSIDGLGPDLFLSQFALPRNGAPGITPGRTYAFEYGNALMVALDCTSDIAAQSQWLDSVLKKSKATWKFASYHFPNFEPEFLEEYADMTKLWSSLFDQYHVDMVFQGHVHYYMRTKPIRNGQPVESPEKGTIYVISIGIEDRDHPRAVPAFAEKAFGGAGLYQTIRVDGNRMTFRALDKNDKVYDELVLQK